LRDYFDSLVSVVQTYVPYRENASILEIACNDGTQLDSFKKAGYATYGIDPAENLYPLSSKNHDIVCDYFDQPSIEKLSIKEFDVILAENVFAHVNYPQTFAQYAKSLLKPGGKIFIQTSQANMVSLGQFDTVYHEHISFFNIRSMVKLLEKVGLYLEDVQKPSIHGTSYLFVISSNPNDDHSQKLIELESSQTPLTIEKFRTNALESVNDLRSKIEEYRLKNIPIIGYGAAAKGNTLLNFGRLDLDYIVDDNPLKHNLYTPGRRIPIVSLDTINKKFKDKPVAWIPLSWNFFKEIKEKINHNRKEQQDFFIQIKFSNLK